MLIENRSPDMETEVTVRVEFTSGTATGLSHSFVTIELLSGNILRPCNVSVNS